MNISPMIYELSSMKSIKRCLKKELGLTICPEVAIQKELETQQLVSLNKAIFGEKTSVIMIWHSQKWASPILKQFLDISQKIISA